MALMSRAAVMSLAPLRPRDARLAAPAHRLLRRHTSNRTSSSSGGNSGSSSEEANEQDEQHGWRRWLPPRVPLFAGLGFVGAYHVYSRVKDTDFSNTRDDVPLTIRLFLSLPLRETSRIWGAFNCGTALPRFLRAPLYRMYSLVYDVNLDEMVNKDLESYENLGAFFNRAIDIGAYRPFDSSALLCSPADGTVVAAGEVPAPDSQAKEIEIKGVPYVIPSHLANMRYCVIYLAPGDYHRCHAPSPSKWSVEALIHTPGHLLPVRPSLLNVFPSLYVVNERITMLGSYKFGRLAMSLVGATNVGSIRVRTPAGTDAPFVTNNQRQDAACIGLPAVLATSPDVGIRDVLTSVSDDTRSAASSVEVFGKRAREFSPQEEVGGFLLGSTVVLFFDAPKDSKWSAEVGSKVRVGQALLTK